MGVRPGDGPAGGLAVVLDHGENTIGRIGRDREPDNVGRRQFNGAALEPGQNIGPRMVWGNVDKEAAGLARSHGRGGGDS